VKQERSLARALTGSGLTTDFSGVWRNELMSEVTLVQSGDTLTGTYESTVSGRDTRTIGDIVGYVDGDLIAFVVHWREYQAVTSWVGQLEPNAAVQTIKALWHMARQVTPGSEWGSINAGADSFTRDWSGDVRP
jgi:hypothetical protein